MKEYLDFLALTIMTAATLGVVLMVVAGVYMTYRFFKDEY